MRISQFAIQNSSLAKAVKLPDESLLKCRVHCKVPFVPINKCQKPRLKVVPVHNLLVGVDDMAGSVFCPYRSAVLCTRLVQQAAPDTHVEVPRSVLVEFVFERTTVEQK